MSDETHQHEWEPDGCAPLRGTSLPPPPAKSMLLRRFPMFRVPISYTSSGAYNISLACADRWRIYTSEKMTLRLLVLMSLVCITIFCAGLLCFLAILRKRRIRRTHVRQALRASGPQHWQSTYPGPDTGPSTSVTGDVPTLEGGQFLDLSLPFETSDDEREAIVLSIINPHQSRGQTQLKKRNVGRGSSRSSGLSGAEDPPAPERVGTGLHRRLVKRKAAERRSR